MPPQHGSVVRAGISRTVSVARGRFSRAGLRSGTALGIFTIVTAGVLLFPLSSAPGAPVPPSLSAQGESPVPIYLPVALRDGYLSSGKPEPAATPALGEWTADAAFVYGGPARAVDVSGDLAYVAIGSHVVVMDVSEMGPPEIVGASPPLPGSVRDVVVEGTLAFAAVDQITVLEDSPAGMFVLDLSVPHAPRVIGHGELIGGATDLAVEGERVLVLSGEVPWAGGTREHGFRGLALFDVSDPTHPEMILERSDPRLSTAWDVAISGTTGYVCDSEVWPISLTAPDSAVTLDETIPCSALAVSPDGSRLAAVSEMDFDDVPTLRILDITRPFEPELLGMTSVAMKDTVENEAFFEDVDFTETAVHAAGWHPEGGFRVLVDVSDETLPVRTAAITTTSALLGIAEAGDGVVHAGIRTRPEDDDSHWMIREGVGHLYGSRVERAPIDGPHEWGHVVEGPGTIVTSLVTHGERAYVFEQALTDGSGWVWALDVSASYPRAVGGFEIRSHAEDLFESHGGAFAATNNALFAPFFGYTRVYDVRDDRMLPVTDDIPGGSLAARGDQLVVATERGILHSFDVSNPVAPRPQWTYELPSSGPGHVAIDGRLLWVVAEGEPVVHESMASESSTSDVPAVMLFELEGMAEPRLLGQVDLVEADFAGGVDRIAADDGQAVVVTSDEGYDVRLTLLRASGAEGPPALESTTAINDEIGIGAFPFALGFDDGVAWLADGESTWGEGEAFALDLEVEAPRLVKRRALPAAVRARWSTWVDDRSSTPGALSLGIHRGRLVGTDLEGGFFGIDGVALPEATATPAPPTPTAVPSAIPTAAATPVPDTWNKDAEFVLGGPARAVDVVGDIAFVGLGAHLVAYDVSGGGDPVALGASPSLPGDVLDVVIRDGIAYAAVQQSFILGDSPGGLFVLDVSDPRNMKVVGRGAISGGAEQVVVDGTRAVLLGTQAEVAYRSFVGLTVFDIKKPSEPIFLRSEPLSLDRGNVALAGDTAYLCDSRKGLAIYDLSAESGMPAVREIEQPCVLVAVTPGAEHLITVSEQDDVGRVDFSLFDLSDPHSPLLEYAFGGFGSIGEAGAEYKLTDLEVDWPSIFISGWHESEGGVVFDSADISSRDAIESIDGEYFEWPILDVGVGASRAVFVGASDVRRDLENTLAMLEDVDGTILASELMVAHRDREVGEIRRTTIGAARGPGTLLTVLAAHDGMVFALQKGISRNRDFGLIWAIDITGAVPIAHQPLEIEGSRRILDLEPDAFAASSDGLFIADDGIQRFKVIDGRVERVERLGGGLAVAVDGGHVYAISESNQLVVYESDGEEGRPAIATLDIPLFAPRRIAVSDGRLWIMNPERYFSPEYDDVALFDVRDPALLRLAGTSVITSELRGGFVAGRLLARGEHLHVPQGEREDALAGIITLTSTDLDGPPSAAITFESDCCDFWALRFASGLAGDHLWLASRDFKGFGRPTKPASMMVLDVGDPTTTRVVEERIAPAAIRARRSDRYDELRDTLGGARLSEDGEMILGSVMQGGLFGLSR